MFFRPVYILRFDISLTQSDSPNESFLYVLSTDGCFFSDGAFMASPPPKTADLEELFRYEVFKILNAKFRDIP